MASFATQVQIRRGTEAENDAFTGAEGEVTMDLTNKQLRVHDGQTTGGMKIPNINTVFGTSQIQDGAITESKLSADLQTKINEKTSGAGRNIGDIFWTTRTDSALNGAVEANGAQYNFADVNGGDNNVQALLVSGALPSVSIAEFDAKVASDGGCDSFGYDSGATYFKVPKKLGRVLVRSQKPTADNNYTWYNLYADGWCEQGGKGISTTRGTITFPIEMYDGNYCLTFGGAGGASTNNTFLIGGFSRGTTGFTIQSLVVNSNSQTSSTNSSSSTWQVSGYAAASEYTKDKWDYQHAQVERPMVQLFNSATDEAVATCTEVLSDVADLKDLSNITSTGKETVVSWGMPDYDSGIEVPFNSSMDYAAPCDGFIHFKGNGINADLYAPNGGGEVKTEYWLSVNYCSIMNPIKKGYRCKYRSGGEAYSSVIFYPAKGANNV